MAAGMSNALLKRLLSGQKDSRSAVGEMARGSNVYNAGSPAAQHGGGPNMGRPPKGTSAEGNPSATVTSRDALERRLQRYRNNPRGRFNK